MPSQKLVRPGASPISPAVAAANANVSDRNLSEMLRQH